MRDNLRKNATTMGLPAELRDASKIIRIGGLGIHVRRFDNDGTPATVVFESALGCPCTEWTHIQQQLLMKSGIPSISYDRPGIGWSEPKKGADSAEQHVFQLSSLLTYFGIDQAVFVGHSVGGLLVRSFAARYPERVAGMVLVDSSHPDQHFRSSRQREGLFALRAQLRISARRQARNSVFGGDVALLPKTVGQLTHEIATSRTGARWALAEIKALLSSWERDVFGHEHLERLPLAIITAGDMVQSDPAHWILQKELAQLSSVSSHLVIDDATHQGIVMDPRHAIRVTKAIQEIHFTGGNRDYHSDA